MHIRRALGWLAGALVLGTALVSASAGEDDRVGFRTSTNGLLANTSDYTYMWWTHGLRDERRTFSIQTNRFAIQFDVPKLQLTHLLAVKNPPGISAALTQRNTDVFGDANASLRFALEADGKGFEAVGASTLYQNCHLVESGRFFQRRLIEGIRWQAGAPKVDAECEIAAWPDRLTLLLRVTPTSRLEDGALQIALQADDNWFVKTDRPAASITKDANVSTARLDIGDWPAGEERTVALIVQSRMADDASPKIVARQIAPARAPLDIVYDHTMGWHCIELRNDPPARTYHDSSNDRIERVKLFLNNPSTTARTARLNFAKGRPLTGGVFGITGLSAMLRDADGNPTGIPVQISKNWHAGKPKHAGDNWRPQRYRGTYDTAGQKQWNSRMKALHRRNGPVLTEATYAGRSHDTKIDLQYTVSLYRTDDITRGVYHFRYDVRDPATFSRLVLFQCGGDDYSYTGERKFARGNEDGLVEEWSTQWGGNRYKTEPVEIAGRIPWFSMHQAVPRARGKEAWANRGIILRHWDAKLGGRSVRPWAAERGAKVRGTDTSLLDILPPPEINRLEAGDYVEGVVEHIVMPQFADDYYGPNENLRSALRKWQDTWRMIHREAIGNDLDIEVTTGQLLRVRPTIVRAEKDRAEFAITGGLAYVPITIAGLTDYRSLRSETAIPGRRSTRPSTARTTGRPTAMQKTAPGKSPTPYPWILPATSACAGSSVSGLEERRMPLAQSEHGASSSDGRRFKTPRCV